MKTRIFAKHKKECYINQTDSEFQILIDEMRLRNFSNKTIEAYLYHNQRFLNFIDKPKLKVTAKDIKQYLLYLNDKGKSSSTINLVHSSLIFYYTKILKRKFYDISYQKREQKRPYCPSQEEILRMINVTKNLKHKIVISLLYSSGLRLSELQDLRIKDIDFQRRLIIVKQGKGAKDRITIISDHTLNLIENYLEQQKNVEKLAVFDSRCLLLGTHGQKYSKKSVQKVIQNACKKIGIKKNISPHSLRHAFATSHIKHGTQTKIVQKMLGHKDIKTTNRYLHFVTDDLERVKSPLDEMKFKI